MLPGVGKRVIESLPTQSTRPNVSRPQINHVSSMFHPTFFASGRLIKTSLTNKHISSRFILNNDNVSTFGHVLLLKLGCNLPPGIQGISTVFSKLRARCIFYKQPILLKFFGHKTVKTFLVIFYKEFSEC